ncbi:NADPH-dependent FMN reductase [Actinomycetospora termitidis]|uniref:NAD(P)H-dependent oxidoreductase n=1 Tax=Actinomycetospora termitidis TaxID=3053470 RepID=A0ABT7MIE7_9PSEU|nr:NAD(P)H-dependent oxidoreductase [Actinomycetospora sp. Odt1-22]MDL5159088.1 NAD(P)H-dependent oxidoreductase [Actinomycetospora sp. Odt1-22]
MPTVLLLSGSTRVGSTNTALLRTAAALRPEGTRLYDGLKALPAFDPDDDVDPLPPAVATLRAALAAADALLICTPEYAGALPGAFKNLLDWTVGGAEMPGMRVGWINAAGVAAPTGGQGAHGELATVLGYVQARIVETACRRVPLQRSQVGDDGLIADPEVRREVRAALDALT